MTIYNDEPQPETVSFAPVPPQRGRHRAWRLVMLVLTGCVLLLIGTGIGSSTKAAPKPAPTVTITQSVPGPTVTDSVPGPATTVTASPPQPASGTQIGAWSGSGNQATPAFNVPDSGNYVVTWSYYGNVDSSLGMASNFIIMNTGDGTALGLPNVISSSGSGSTEVTGASGTDSFNVQSLGHWTITVKSA